MKNRMKNRNEIEGGYKGKQYFEKHYRKEREKPWL